MRSKATLNANEGQIIARSIGRIPILKAALLKPSISDERKASLQAELDRRQTHLKQILEAATDGN